MNEDLVSGGIYSDLLNQFEIILDSDPLIDEVGFIHPSQFATLNAEAGSSLTTSDSNSLQCIDVANQENASFWVRDHKLGISTHVLLPLYKAAKHAFMSALVQHKVLENPLETSGDKSNLLQFSSSCNSIESKVMRHSRALILLSCDFGTAWNSRKLIVSKQQHMSTFIDELLFSGLVLSYSPKSEQAWCHRRWVIKMIAQKCSALEEIVRKESELVEQIAERSKMNYRAWNHRCWLVSYMTREQVNF
uniref:Uncharacterized protein MANES_08G139500 n=1 Tax=Rhizophora mucronata TaxID=61149 RepID=A0A2P2JX49_RHIMU